MRIVDDNQPKLLGLLEIIRLFVEHRRSVILKRSKYKLDEINKRINFLSKMYLACVSFNPYLLINICLASSVVEQFIIAFATSLSIFII